MTRYRSKKLVLGLSSLGIVAAVAALAIGGTMALFSSTASPVTSSFTAGYMTLTGLNTTSGGTCTFVNQEPGGIPTKDSMDNNLTVGMPATCDYTLTYNGNINAYVQLNVSTTSAVNPTVPAPNGSTTSYGGETLIDGTPTGLMVNVLTQPTNNPAQVFGIGTLTPGSGCTAITGNGGCSQSSDNGQMVNGYSYSNGLWHPGETETIEIQAELPITAGDQYEGGSATVTVQAEAVQADNNTGDCNGSPYYGDCSNGYPVAQGVTIDTANSSVVMDYNENVEFSNNSPSTWVQNFIVQDESQPMVNGSYDTCPVTAASVSSTNGANVDLTYGTCNGHQPQAGDLFNVTYYQGPAGGYLIGANSDPSTGAYYWAEEPQAFFNQVSS